MVTNKMICRKYYNPYLFIRYIQFSLIPQQIVQLPSIVMIASELT